MASNLHDADASKRAHVLMMVIPAAGHFGPFVQLLYHLDANCPGIKVTLVTPKNFLPQISDLKSKGDFGRINLVTEEIPGVIPKFDDPKFPIRVSQISKQNFLETEALRKKFIENKGTAGAPTSIVCDMFLFWAKNFADELGVPCYMYFSTSPMGTVTLLENPKVTDAIVDPNAPGTAVKFLPEIVPDLVAAPGLSFVHVGDLPPERFQFREFFFPLREATLKVTGVLNNSAEELDASFGAVAALKEILGSTKAFYIGPSIQVAGFGKVYASAPTDKVLPWLNLQRQKSVLFVAFGSLGTVTKESILELAAGLEASGVPFLWALKPGSDKLSDILPGGFQERTTDRGLIDPTWVNQTEILRHPAVGGFLTHCGWNSMMESICSGVPFVAWPLSAEQMINARYIENFAQIGVTIASFKEQDKHRFDDVTEKEISIAIRKLMVDEDRHHFASNVLQLQELATKAVQPGGSSHEHLHSFLHAISS